MPRSNPATPDRHRDSPEGGRPDRGSPSQVPRHVDVGRGDGVARPIDASGRDRITVPSPVPAIALPSGASPNDARPSSARAIAAAHAANQMYPKPYLLPFRSDAIVSESSDCDAAIRSLFEIHELATNLTNTPSPINIDILQQMIDWHLARRNRLKAEVDMHFLNIGRVRRGDLIHRASGRVEEAPVRPSFRDHEVQYQVQQKTQCWAKCGVASWYVSQLEDLMQQRGNPAAFKAKHREYILNSLTGQMAASEDVTFANQYQMLQV